MHCAHAGQPIQVSEHTSPRPAESSDGMKADDPRAYTQDYGSIIRPGVGGGLEQTQNYGAGDLGPEDEGSLHDASTQLHMTPASFRCLIRTYGLVPIISVITILFFALIRRILWPGPSEASSPFPWHLGLAVLGAAVWTVSFALRVPIYLFSCLICHMRTFTPFLSASFQVFFEELLRFSSLLLMHLPVSDNSSLSVNDPAFSNVWTLALGWAAAEVTVSVYQGYRQLFLYGDLTCPDDPTWSHHRRLPTMTEGRLFDDPENTLTEEIDLVIRSRIRRELEALYGIPVPDIPVFVSCLLRIDSITLTIALYLIISSSYLSYLNQSLPAERSILLAIRHTIPMFLVLFVLRAVLSFSWTLNILPRIGLHAASYVSCMFALGALFVGLGRWDAV